MNRDARYLVFERVGQMVAIGIVNVVVLRQLGPTTFGYLGAATALLAMFLPFAGFGQLPVIRNLSMSATRGGSGRAMMRFGVVLSTIGSSIGAFGLALAGMLAESGPTKSLIYILCLVFLCRPLWGLEAWYRAHSFNARASIIRSIGVYSGAVGRLIVAFSSESLVLLALFVVVEHCFSALLFWVDYSRIKEPAADKSPDGLERKEMVVAAVPMLISGLAVMVYMRIDQPMLLWFSSSTEVGLYSAAANLSDALSFVPTIVSTIIMPVAFRKYAADRVDFQVYISHVLGFITGVGYMVLVSGLLVAGPLIHLLYGEMYDESVHLLVILLFSVPFIFSGVVRAIWMVAAKHQNLQLVHTVIAAVLNIALNVVLIPAYGATGAAASTVFCHFVANFALNLFHAETRVVFFAQLRAFNPFYSFPIVWRCIRTRSL